MTDSAWRSWCESKQLPIESAHFALPTCYYGLGFRTRPGTLLVTDEEIIHYSYAWRDTRYAIFEPSLRLSFPLAEIAAVDLHNLSPARRLLLGWPESCFRVDTRHSASHYLSLQRDGARFAKQMDRLAVPGIRAVH